MDLLSLGLILLLSIIACWASGEFVRRKEIKINRWALLAFHLLYGVGLVGVMLFL
ncbi:MAG: hypothetical protein ACFFF4_14660 [Candidatus Thorarchaeota archaeon]